MQYSHKTCATSPGPGPIVRWPTSGAPLGSQSLSVVAALIEVGGPWPHSPLGDERLTLGLQSLSVVAALRSAGGLLRRGSGQLKVEGRATGAGAGAGAAVQRTRKDRVAQLDLLDDDRAHVVLELHAPPGLGVGGGAGGS